MDSEDCSCQETKGKIGINIWGGEYYLSPSIVEVIEDSFFSEQSFKLFLYKVYLKYK